MSVTTCPGCGLRSSEAGVAPDRPVRASAACWGAYAELVGFELEHAGALGRLHQLTVDAYGAQHGDAEGTSLRTAYSLVGLCLALEHGWTGPEVRELHARMGRRQPWWPLFRPPEVSPVVTVLDVVNAGARAGSVDGHASKVERWVRAVWESWASQSVAIRGFTDEIRRQTAFR